jgi:hypothetical protein
MFVSFEQHSSYEITAKVIFGGFARKNEGLGFFFGGGGCFHILSFLSADTATGIK